MSFGKSFRPGPRINNNQNKRDYNLMSSSKKLFGPVGKAIQAYQSALKTLKPVQPIKTNYSGVKVSPVVNKELHKYVQDYLNDFAKQSTKINAESNRRLKEKIDALSPSAQDDKEIIQKITASHIPKVSLLPGSSKWTEFSRVLTSVQTRNVICMSIDIEAWEKNPKIITEIGISIWDPRIESGQYSISSPSFDNHHILINESLALRNTQFMPDHKHQYLMGKSKIMSMKQCQVFIQELIDEYMIPDADAPESEPGYERAFVGHGFSGDLKWLQSLNLRIPENIPVFDTMKIFQSMYGSTGSGLGKALRLLQIPHAYMHNAGNDAYYTLRLLLHMCDIEKRKLLGLDDIEKVQNTIEQWRSHDSGGNPSGSSKRRRKNVATEFQGSVHY